MSATLLSDRYSHLPSIRTPPAALVAIGAVVVPLLRSLPVLARINERFLIVRSSIARLSLATLSSGIGTHCRTQNGYRCMATAIASGRQSAPSERTVAAAFSKTSEGREPSGYNCSCDRRRLNERR
jgi:hypothetical protein